METAERSECERCGLPAILLPGAMVGCGRPHALCFEGPRHAAEMGNVMPEALKTVCERWRQAGLDKPISHLVALPGKTFAMSLILNPLVELRGASTIA